jgi:hypothetical protein
LASRWIRDARRDWPLGATALGLTAVTFIVGRLHRCQSVEDAYITYRCARNFALGHGLVYNIGERVEAFTNFLFALLLGVGVRVINADPAKLALAINLLALWTILVALFKLQRRADAPDAAVYPPWLAWLFVALIPSMVVYTHSGMETVFFTALFFWGFAGVVLHLERGGPAWVAGVLFALAADVRMEAAIFAVVGAALVWWYGDPARRGRNALWLVAGFIAVFAPVLIARWTYYGYPFPNTYYAKVGGGSVALFVRGFFYSLSWLVWTWPAALALLLAWRVGLRTAALRQRTVIGLCFIAVYFLYNAYVGGDYFAYHRFFVPVLPIIGWLLEGQWRVLRTRLPAARFRRALVFAAACLFFVVSCVVIFYRPSQWTKYRGEQKLIGMWTRLGRSMHDRIRGPCSVYLLPAGALPYHLGSRFRVHDSTGLTDPVLAHQKMDMGFGIPGHERWDHNRVLAMKPDVWFVGVFPPGVKEIKNLKDLLSRMVEDLLPDSEELEDIKDAEELAGLLKEEIERNLAQIPFAALLRPLIESTRAKAMKTTQFFNNAEFQSHYELAKFVHYRGRTIFFVRRDAPTSIRRHFKPLQPEKPKAAGPE